jgi:hypothetical protein
MTSEAETLAWPPWLEGEMTNRERLAKIMTAVHRCYMEHPDGGMVPTGPHMTVAMAEQFIAQMMSAPTGE